MWTYIHTYIYTYIYIKYAYLKANNTMDWDQYFIFSFTNFPYAYIRKENKLKLKQIITAQSGTVCHAK